MTDNKQSIINELSTAFSLSNEEAETAFLLLQARAQVLDYTFPEYMQRYHPEGIAGRDENLPGQWQGYVQFLGGDAASVLKAGKSADFFTFVHECAHVFRRQLTGELREQAERAFGIKNGLWDVEKEELFADGLEQWIKARHGREKGELTVYGKGEVFIDTVYHGMERIVEIDRRMEEVYERLFEDRQYTFYQSEYANTVKELFNKGLPETHELFMGMTSKIYEDLNFQRLPVSISTEHLSAIAHADKTNENNLYDTLTEEIFHQIPEQLKNPFWIVQDGENETGIITVLSFEDKSKNEILIPLKLSQNGHLNRAEIDINLAKTFSSNEHGFEHWLKEASAGKRLLYIDNKKQESAFRFPQVPATDASGFVTENRAEYIETVRQKSPERLIAEGQEHILFKGGEQLTLDFSTAPQQAANPSPVIEQQSPVVPHPNTPEYFTRNFAAIAGDYKSDSIEAARFLLRSMEKDHRETTLAFMRENGCTDRESYHRYLYEILAVSQNAQAFPLDVVEQDIHIEDEVEQRQDRDPKFPLSTGEIISGREIEKESETLDSTPEETPLQFPPFGAWTDFTSRLSVKEREHYNGQALAVLEKAGEGPLSEDDKALLRRYSGFGGISADGGAYCTIIIPHLRWHTLHGNYWINREAFPMKRKSLNLPAEPACSLKAPQKIKTFLLPVWNWTAEQHR